jgi:hypothetical protein
MGGLWIGLFLSRMGLENECAVTNAPAFGGWKEVSRIG